MSDPTTADPTTADYWTSVTQRWSEAISAAISGRVSETVNLRQQLIQILATGRIVATGMRGAGKSAIYAALADKPYKRGESKKVERHRVKVTRGGITFRARFAILPGDRSSRPRRAGIARIFEDENYPLGVIHVVSWGLAEVWDPGGRQQILKFLRFKRKSENLEGVRERLRTQELEDFRRTCDLLEIAWSGKGDEVWLIIAVTKCDLYWDNIDDARQYYIPGDDPDSDSPFAAKLRTLANDVGLPRLAVLPVSSREDPFIFTDKIRVQPAKRKENWRAALLSQFRNTMGEFGAT
jgi:hypothetical protein